MLRMRRFGRTRHQERGASNLYAAQEVETTLGLRVVSIVTLANLLDYLRGQKGMEQHLSAIATYQQTYGI